MFKKRIWVIGIIILFTSLLIACNDEDSNADAVNNNNNNNNDNNNENVVENEENNVDELEEPEEVTLTLAYAHGVEGFEIYFEEPLKEALPHINLEWEEVNIGLADDVEDLLATGVVPDFWVGSGSAQLRIMRQFEMDYAVDELFERHNFDWSRLNPGVEEYIRNQTHDKTINMIPMYIGADSLYYNKDIFDIFGVDYPTDRMTWEEVKDLAAEVTGERNGIQYRGFDMNSPQMMLDQRQVTHIDPETDEVLFLEEPIYAEYVSYLEDLWSIPGILPEEDPGDYLYRWGANFFNDHDVAMSIAWDRFPNAQSMEEAGLNWDLVTMPVWEDQPNIITPPDATYIFPTRDPEHPDAVFEVLNHILSDEYQEWSSRELGRTTVLDDPEIQATLAADIEGLEDKNMESIFMMDHNPGLPVEEVSKYAGLEYNALYRGVQDFADLDTDVNTFLRIMKEETEENIRRAQERE